MNITAASLAFGLTLTAFAASAGTDCSDAVFAGTLDCAAPKAAAQKPGGADAAWLACGGDCLVSQSGSGVSVRLADGSQHSLKGATFLHGYGATSCLSRAIAVTLGGATLAASIRALEAGLPQIAVIDTADIPLAPDTAQLSCSGTHLIAADVDGNGGAAIFDAATGAGVPPSDGEGNWLMASPDGTYGVEVLQSGGYRVTQLGTGRSTQIPALHEIDRPAFGADNSFALVRASQQPVRTEIYDLQSGQQVHVMEGALPLGLPFMRVGGGVQSLSLDPAQ